MSFIELHVYGEPRLINVDAIAEVMPSRLESAITFIGQAIPNCFDECYENVRAMLVNASTATKKYNGEL